METYEVDASYDGKWWVFDIPALFTTVSDRQITARGQARTAADVAPEARGIAAMWTNADEDAIQVKVNFSMPEDVRGAIERARDRENVARSAGQEAAQARRFAARALVNDQGMSQSDAATMLGVSRQRVHQLIS